MKPPTVTQLKAHARTLPGPAITMPHLYRFIDHANQYRPGIWSRKEEWGACLLRWWSLRQDHPPIPGDVARPVKPRFFQLRRRPLAQCVERPPRPVAPPSRLARAVDLALNCPP